MSKLSLALGDEVHDEGTNRDYTVTPDDLFRVALLRGACVVASWGRSTLLYGDVAPLVGLATQGLGRALDLLSEDCVRRGEPSLAALLVKQETGLAGAGFTGNDPEEREKCYQYWRHERGRRG